MSCHSGASEWNSAYFDLVARSLSGLTADAIDRLCLDPVLCLPDEAFLDVMAELLLSLDAVYLNDKGLGEADAVRLRAALAERMEKTSSWLDHEHRPGYGVEYHLSNALEFFAQNVQEIKMLVLDAKSRADGIVGEFAWLVRGFARSDRIFTAGPQGCNANQAASP